MYSNNTSQGQRIANGAITAFSIVCEDTASDGKAILSTANRGRQIGIGPNYDVADGVAFQYTWGGVAQVKLGGSVTAGDYIKSDASGFGVVMAVTATVPQHVIGVALRSGSANDIIPVQVNPEAMTVGQDYLS